MFMLKATDSSAVKAFDAWVAAAADAERALGSWLRSAVGDRRAAYAAYRASLDREEQAALVLAAASRRR